MRARLALVPALLALSGCDCAGEKPHHEVDAGTDAGLECEGDEARLCRNATMCCPEGEECVRGYDCAPLCENERCGDNALECCAVGQVCLDGVVCAADCGRNRALCGAALDTCCEEGQVCVEDACLDPGSVCEDDYDCRQDDTYCEPTIGRCLPNPSPPLCEVRPTFEDIELEVEWHWEGGVVNGRSYQNVSSTPMVGDVSGDGVPDVVVAAYAGTNLGDTMLFALNGDDGTVFWVIEPGADAPGGLSAVALANLDTSDDSLEVVYRVDGDGLRVISGDDLTELARLEVGSAATTSAIAPAIADMDQDGVIDIAVGCHVLGFEEAGPDFALTTRFDDGECSEPNLSFAGSAFANLDDDPELELTTGASAYDPNGVRKWPAAGVTPAHGIPAVADLDADGAPEVIQVRDGAVTVRDGATGVVRLGPGGTWAAGTVAIPGGGNGGAPTVADFDGDGLPEVSAAGRGCYAVYDVDCLADPPRAGGDCTRPEDDPDTTCDDNLGQLIRWARPTQDISSSITGSSVFDFQGDGVAEVIYNDECFLHVYDGRDGRDLLTTPRPSSSRTALEYPVVVDVDRDGNSEIVVPSNDDQAVDRDHCDERYAEALGVSVDQLPADIRTGTHGVTVYGDPADRWVRTRLVWNQFTYHVTNIEDFGDVPPAEMDNWTTPGLNNYRQNVQGQGVFNAPDLEVALEAVAECSAGSVRLSAVVTNRGSRGVAEGVTVSFVRLEPGPEEVVASGVTEGPLLPGASERVTVVAEDVPLDVDLTFEARVDDGNAIAECDEDDGAAQAEENCPSFG